MKDSNAINLTLQGLKTMISGLSFGSLLITFINSIINSGASGTNNINLVGIILTLFIYFVTKFVEYIENVLKDRRMFGKHSVKINIAGIIVAFLFSISNLVFCLINVDARSQLIFVIFDLVFVVFYLTADMAAFSVLLYNYKN